jgi:hypothetical protein
MQKLFAICSLIVIGRIQFHFEKLFHAAFKIRFTIGQYSLWDYIYFFAYEGKWPFVKNQNLEIFREIARVWKSKWDFKIFLTSKYYSFGIRKYSWFPVENFKNKEQISDFSLHGYIFSFIGVLNENSKWYSIAIQVSGLHPFYYFTPWIEFYDTFSQVISILHTTSPYNYLLIVSN